MLKYNTSDTSQFLIITDDSQTAPSTENTDKPGNV